MFKAALLEMRSFVNSPDFQIRNDISAEWSEEDEKIRKALIRNFTNQHSSNFPTVDGFTREQILNWLEKQDEQETLCDKCRKEHPSHFCQDITALGRCAVEHEQKSADKLEPKFKVRDWVIVQDKLCQIEKVTELYHNHYQYWTTDGHWFGDGTEAHLWSIKDAKDGDVLYSQCSIPFIYNGYYEECKVGAYCGIAWVDGQFIDICDGLCWVENKSIKPATKEQYNLFFKKMKEVGYERDAEKKELKKR